MDEPLPTLLIVTRLTQPFEQASNMLTQLASDLNPHYPRSSVEGALVMAVAALEVAFSDSLRYYLQNFSAKLPKDHIRNAGEALPVNMVEQIEASALRYTVALGSKPLKEFITQYEKLVSVDICSSQPDLIADIQEIKATRNLLLHNGLVVNEFHEEQAGSKRREARGLSNKLLVDHSYVIKAVAVIHSFIEVTVSALKQKYGKYTKIAAHRRLWKYLFDSPIMPYDDFWVVDEMDDKIVAMKVGSHESSLSSTELLFLGLWRAHFNSNGEYLARLNMRGFDRQNLRSSISF